MIEQRRRIAQFREARKFVELFPDRFRIRFHRLGRGGEWFGWTLEELVRAVSFRTCLFLPRIDSPEVITSGFSVTAEVLDWTIIDYPRRLWRPESCFNSRPSTQKEKQQ